MEEHNNKSIQSLFCIGNLFQYKFNFFFFNEEAGNLDFNPN